MLDLTAGLDLRYYQGIHQAVICDLMSGDYFIDATRVNSVSAANNYHRNDDNWAYEKLNVGDVVYRDYTGHVMQEGAFATLEYSTDALSAFVNGSLSYTDYWRVDRFYYDEEHQISDGDVRDLEKGVSLFVEVRISVNPAQLDEEEIHEMQQEAGNEEDARPDLQFRACVCLGTLWLMVALRTRHLVGDG